MFFCFTVHFQNGTVLLESKSRILIFNIPRNPSPVLLLSFFFCASFQLRWLLSAATKQLPAGGPVRQTERPLHKLQWPLCNHAVLVYWNPGQKCPLTRMSRRGILNIEKVLPIDGQPLVISVYAIDRIPLPRGRSFAFIDFFGDFESQADRSQNNSDKSDHYRQFFHIHCPPFFRLEGRALRRGLTAYRY